MRPPGDSTGLPSIAGQLDRAAKELEDEPKAQVDHGWNFDEPGNDEDWHQGKHATSRIENEIGPQHAGNRARRADRGNRRIRGGQRLRCERNGAAEQVKQQEPEVPQTIFDVVAENPKVKHVPDDVGPPSVQKHRGENRDEPVRAERISPAGGPEHEARRDEPESLQQFSRS